MDSRSFHDIYDVCDAEVDEQYRPGLQTVMIWKQSNEQVKRCNVILFDRSTKHGAPYCIGRGTVG